MRDFGYTLETALADVVDNSITNGATAVQIETEMFAAEPWIAIIDDGVGMSEDDLLDAMVPGSQDPRVERDARDLGRFGLGLKTASFSQCRRLTVITKRDGRTSAACWDLDRVSEANDWLLELPDPGPIEPFAAKLGNHGTVVVWQVLDRLVGIDPNKAARTGANVSIDGALDHLALVFHRFLEGEPNLPKIEITVNGRALDAFDPFRRKHQATIQSPVETIEFSNRTITIQAFTLPHHSKVSAADWERYGGREGYVKNQGFYVYRSGRLIIHGTWFGLARHTEPTKLCRVKIDLPNSLDAEWKVDVKKASAQPPRIIRDRLRGLVANLGGTSRRVYTHRGTRLVDENLMPVWVRVQREHKINFAINREHPYLAKFHQTSVEAEFESAVSLIESALPLDALLADLGNSPDAVVNAEIADNALEEAVRAVLLRLRATNASDDVVSAVFEVVEPFRSNRDRTRSLLDALGAATY
jgi:hypothetical protein